MSRILLYFLGAIVAAGVIAFLWWTISPLFIDSVVDEEFEYEETVAAPQAARAVREGSFVGADRLHQGSGVARLIETPEGALVRLENFEVTNGPDLYVVLAEGEEPRSSSELGEHLEVARLKGNIGNQTYELPEGIDTSRYQSVVIYCRAFSVIFATAPLATKTGEKMLP